MRRLVLLLLVLGLGLGLWLPTGSVQAQGEVPPEEVESPLHIVAPGETLFSIARRYGVDLATLARVNNIPDPRQIYAGQRLRLPLAPAALDTSAWQEHPVTLGEDFSLLAQVGQIPWEKAALANSLLNPSQLLVGQTVRLPAATPVHLLVAEPNETRLTTAIRQGVPFWEVVRLNPEPLYAGRPVVLPGKATSAFVPYPLVSLALSQQPLPRGQTGVLAVETAVPASCDLTYLDQNIPCYAQDATHLYVLLGFSPMLDPGRYEASLRLQSAAGDVALTLPLVISAGRFGFERIDLPANLQNLLDPVLIQAEADKMAYLSGVRTPQRYWQLPFPLPVQAAVSSYFGSRRSYGGAYSSYHAGVDLRAGTGVRVRAPAAGVVVLAEPLAVRGNAVMVDHGWGVLTGYWHLSRIDVKVGQRVSAGDVLGLVGNTGRSTGAHLHWELWVNGVAVDPLEWLTPFYTLPEPVQPIPAGVE